MKPLFNFSAMEAKARGMRKEELEMAIKDCQEAIRAYPDGENVPYYTDEIHVYEGELRRRKLLLGGPRCRACGAAV